MNKFVRFSSSLMVVFTVVACSSSGVSKVRPTNPLVAQSKDFTLAAQNLEPQQAKEILADTGENVIYGETVGDLSMRVVGGVLFPPYGLYLLANTLLEVGGQQGVYVTDALPDEEREQWSQTYGGVAGVPGRISAAIAGKEFRDKEYIQNSSKLSQFMAEQESDLAYTDLTDY